MHGAIKLDAWLYWRIKKIIDEQQQTINADK